MCEIITTSIRGSSGTSIGSGTMRFGPAKETGEAYSEKIGSKSTFLPASRTSTEAWLAYCLNQLGSANHALGDYAEARQNFQASYAIRERLNDAEGMAVAHAKGVQVPSSTVDDVVKAYAALPPQTKSSMLEDLERGRRLELPWLSGAVVRIGRELSVPTPVHAFINAVLKPHVNGTAG